MDWSVYKLNASVDDLSIKLMAYDFAVLLMLKKINNYFDFISNKREFLKTK